MHKFYGSLLLLALCLSFACSETSFSEGGSPNNENHQNTLLAEAEAGSRSGDNDGSNYDKRVERYAFGLGRRAYTYTSGGGGNGVKRLPVYNFGLGKRARPYSFGLGKRAEYDEDLYDQYDNERNYLDEKRSRPYSFGLGKREPVEDVDRRGYPNRYGFGLGRR